MKKALLIVSFIILSTVNARGADWKYIGAYVEEKNKVTGLTFYDSESIVSLPSNHFTVWFKVVNIDDLTIAMQLNKDELTREVNRKVSENYFPPYAPVDRTVKTEDLVSIIAYETAANYVDTKTFSKINFELDCNVRLYRTLHVTHYKSDGEKESQTRTGQWEPISPDSNAENIYKILCKKKK